MSATEKVFLNGSPLQVEDVDMNGFKNENNILIESSNQSLNTGDNTQTSKAVSVYSSNGDFYDEDGSSAPDIYVLTKTNTQKPIFELQEGMRFRFLVLNTNTGPSTISFIGIVGNSNIKLDGLDLSAGDLLAGDMAEMVYSGGVFNLDITKKISFKAYVRFNGAGGVSVINSFNVDSVVRGFSGDYTVNFTKNLNTLNPSFLLSCQRFATGPTFTEASQVHIVGSSVSSIQIQSGAWNSGASIFNIVDNANISVGVI